MAQDPQKDFFISYNKADRRWAEWIAWQLEEANYSTILQAWDFQPGTNFVLEMDRGARIARSTIAVLSADYLNSEYTRPEWAAAFRRDPKSEQRALLPVRVQKCEVEGLLGAIIYFDLVDLDEVSARETLLAGVRRERSKPDIAPSFPGAAQHTLLEPQRFPGALPPVWYVPYQRNRYFTGREDILKKLYEAFRVGKIAGTVQPQANSGLGGIGKTQIVVEYAYQYRNDYQAILWINAETEEELIASFVTIAELLNLPQKGEQHQKKAVKAVKHWLNSHTDWLLIFDNVEDLALVKDYIPVVDQGHILLTTRAHAVGGISEHMEVEKMKPEEGALYLLRRAKIIAADASLDKANESDKIKAREISEAMDGLPLALDQAGAYIEETATSLSDYLNLYQAQHAELLRLRGELVSDHPGSVATTWSLAFKKISQKNPPAVELIRFFSFLHPDSIPEEIITEGAPELGPILQPVAANPLGLNAAIGELLKYSLVRRHPDTKMLTIHRLVQAVLKDEMSEVMQHEWAERTVRAVSRAFPDVEFSMWQRCQRCLPHALACSGLIEQWGMKFTEALRLLDRLGEYLRIRALYPQAELVCKQALTIREHALGPDHPDVAQSLNSLAWVYINQSKYGEAEPLCKRALTIREHALGPDHPDVAQSLNSLAWLYDDLGKYDLVEPLYQRALMIRERALGPNHPDVAQSLNNLAWFYKTQGEYSQAEPLYQRALRIREQTLNPEHPDIASSLNNLGLIYSLEHQYTQAEPFYQRALAIQEQSLGPEHPKVSQSLNNLAELYRAQGRYTEAEPLYQRALRIREQSLGPEHPRVATSLHNLAELYRAQGRYTEAEPLYQRALEILEKTLGSKHPGTTTVLKNYLKLLHQMNREAEAVKLNARFKEDTMPLDHN